MTCIRDILTEEQLEREFESIRKTFKTLKKTELPLRIHWGTKEAMEQAEKFPIKLFGEIQGAALDYTRRELM